jgi:hypothetical protein
MAKQAKKRATTKIPRAKKATRAASAKPTVREVAAPTGKRARAAVAAFAANVTTSTLTYHIYEVTSVPSGCNDWSTGDYMEVPVEEPPPPAITIAMSGPCNGITAKFVE